MPPPNGQPAAQDCPLLADEPTKRLSKKASKKISKNVTVGCG